MDLGGGNFWISVVSLLIAIISVGVAIWTYFKSRMRKIITYELEDNNTNVVSIDRDKGENITILLDGQPVEEVRYQLIKIRNEGNVAIDDQDYNNRPLQIVFRPQTVSGTNPSSLVILRAGISEAAPQLGISSQNAQNHIILDARDQYVALRGVLLNAGDWVKIKVLTLGKANIEVRGQIRDGQIKSFVPMQSRLTWQKGVRYALVGALLFFLLYNSLGLAKAFIQGNCVLGSIEVKGSSAFYTATKSYANDYRATCPVGFVRVDQDTSSSGLSDLKIGTIQIANSELPASAVGLNPADFKDSQVAVIVFTVVISKNVTKITSLTQDQLLKIYTGKYKNWREVDTRAPDLPIKVFGRPETSGTYNAFIHYALKQDTKPSWAPSYQEEDRTDLMADAVALAQDYGAIGYVDEGTAGKKSSVITSVEINQQAPTPALVESGAYLFWAIEHMYTKKDPDGLATSFITYVTNHIETDGTFIKIHPDMPIDILRGHVYKPRQGMLGLPQS